MYCKNCGKEIDDNSTFCQSCGSKVTNSQSSAVSVGVGLLSDVAKAVAKTSKKAYDTFIEHEHTKIQTQPAKSNSVNSNDIDNSNKLSLSNLKCSVCGGSVTIQDGGHFGVCDYCGHEFEIEYTQSEKNAIEQQKRDVSNRLEEISKQKYDIEYQLKEISEIANRKKNALIAVLLSVCIWPAMGVYGASEDIGTAIAGVAIVLWFVAVPFLKKAGVYKDKKSGYALMFLWQYLSIGIFGIVAGIQKLSSLNSMKKQQSKLQVELTEQLREIENTENKLKAQVKW